MLARSAQAAAPLLLAMLIAAPAPAQTPLWTTFGGEPVRTRTSSDAVLSLSSITGQPLTNTEAADDFDARAAVQRLLINGIGCGCGPLNVDGVFVRFYDWTPAGPGAQQAEFFLDRNDPGLVAFLPDPSTLDITLPAPGFIATGRHFVGIQVVYTDFGYWAAIQSNQNSTALLPVHAIDRLGANTWQVDLPPGHVGTFDFSFTIYGTPLAPPAINTISHPTAPRSQRLIILGSNFGDGLASRVLVGDVPAIATTWLPQEIHAYVPEGAPLGPTVITIESPHGASPPQAITVTTRQPQGRVLWRLQTDDRTTLQFPARGPDGRFYTADLRFTYAISPTGGLLWASPEAFADSHGAHPIDFGADGTIYTGIGIENNQYALVVALNPDGSVKWKFVPGTPGDLIAGPNVGPDGRIYAIQEWVDEGGLGAFALNPDGTLAWSSPGNPPIPACDLLANGQIVFGADRLHAGVVPLRSGGNPVLYTFDLDGNQLWTSWDFQVHTTSFPILDPFNRVIATWGQTGIRALQPDGEEDWFRLHPGHPGFLKRPAVDSQGNIYNADLSGLELWALDPDGNTRYVLPTTSEGAGTLGITPDDRVLVLDGASGYQEPLWFRGYNAADGALLWQVDLLPENNLPQFGSSREPAFSADSSTAVVTTQFAGGDNKYGYVLGLQSQDSCPADFNRDGVLNSDDFFAYLTAYAAGHMSADIDQSGTLNSLDFFAYLNLYVAGCG